MLTAFDDFAVHQTAEPVRFVATSDRNFYDRYYFNLHASDDTLFMVMGIGQYPNLGVQDAFACVQRRDDSREWTGTIPVLQENDQFIRRHAKYGMRDRLGGAE